MTDTTPTLQGSLYNASQAADKLLSGGVVVFPTETVYGLGACIRFAEAVARIYEIKGRPTFNPLICHISAMEQLDELVQSVPDSARRLMDAFWPGPLTLVLDKRDSVNPIVTGGLDQVAVRWPKHPIAQKMISEVGHPVAAPSANVSGRLSPTRLEHAWLQLGSLVDGYVEGGVAEAGLESTVIGWENDQPVLLRLGALEVETIEKCLGHKIQTPASDKIKSPGQLLKHYSPLKPIEWEKPRASTDDGECVLLTLQELPTDRARYQSVHALSQRGDLRSAASQFFEVLHRLDDSSARKIIARPLPPQGLGNAMNDRLHRAILSSQSAHR